MNEAKLAKIFNRAVASKDIHEAILLVEKGDGEQIYSAGYGGQTVDSPILIASISKLFTTACIYILKEQGKLSLHDKLFAYIDAKLLTGLHVHKGRDYSDSLTIAHLLSQTSGLPDFYEEGKDKLINRIITEDFSVTLDQVIDGTKQLTAKFPPETAKRAHYSVINFELLGYIIEKITGMPYAAACQTFIFDPLHMNSTYFVSSEHTSTPYVYYKNEKLNRPKYLQSCQASGGAISTTRDLMTFIKAFYGGKLFDNAIFSNENKYRALQTDMFPIQYGSGQMCIPLKNIYSLFLGKGQLIGHSGSTGSFAFYYPHKDIYIVGDINQMTKRALPVQIIMQIAMTS